MLAKVLPNLSNYKQPLWQISAAENINTVDNILDVEQPGTEEKEASLSN